MTTKKVRLVILSAMLMIVAAPLAAIEIVLSDEEKTKCASEGGCGMVSYAWLMRQLEKAFE